MTVDEFLIWAEGKEGRWELHDGVARRITSERVDHVQTKGEAFIALRVAARRAGCDCEVFGSGLAVQIDEGTILAPDASVVCGPKSRTMRSFSQPHRRRRGPVAEHCGDRPRPQAQRVFLAAERRALPHPRSRATRRHPPQARPGRRDRDPRPERRLGEARPAGLCGRGRSDVCAGRELEIEQRQARSRRIE